MAGAGVVQAGWAGPAMKEGNLIPPSSFWRAAESKATVPVRGGGESGLRAVQQDFCPGKRVSDCRNCH